MGDSQVKLVFGGGLFGHKDFATPESVNSVLDILEKNNVEVVDTAQLYGADAGPGGSETLLGKVQASKRFTVDTKASMGFMNVGGATKEDVISGAEESMKRLQTNQVDIFYLHGPNYDVPDETTLDGVNEVYKKGYFKRFGISNYKPDHVRRVYDYCKSKGYPLPVVYQGNYNAVARKNEETLFPVLRELGICFYAYSPIAGGFLAKSKAQVEQGAGRFDPETFLGKMYGGLYSKPILLDALHDWQDIASSENCTPAELAYRWVRFHSVLDGAKGDGLIFGISKVEQLQQTLTSLNNGPLRPESAKRINDIWSKVAEVAPLDNLHGTD